MIVEDRSIIGIGTYVDTDKDIVCLAKISQKQLKSTFICKNIHLVLQNYIL